MVSHAGIGHNGPSFPNFHRVPFHVPNFRNNRNLDLNTLHNSANEVDYYHENQESRVRWDNRGDGGGVPYTVPSRDDGVVLLVGLFNLLAIVIYAAQLTLAKKPIRDEGRVINWQVQKVLDELVLRVHSSTTASNLLARSLRYEPYYRSGRTFFPGKNMKSKNSLSAFLKKHFQGNDPVQLKKWLDSAGGELLEEISNSSAVKRGPKIDPKVYFPLIKLYMKLTQPSRKGRAFETSLLQEIGAAAVMASDMSLKETRQVLKAITQLGRMQRQFDLRPLLQAVFPSASLLGINTGNVVRMKREVGETTEMGEKSPLQKTEDETNPYKKNAIPTRVMGRGQISNGFPGFASPSSSSHRNWADGWFYLMTQAAPLGLDITTLYANAYQNPGCLQGQLCAANYFWSRRGPLHASLTPLLSVMVSWALEYSGGKSLGDSLIAIRAGWMGKDCPTLYPQCLVSNAPHPLARQAADLLSNQITREKEKTKDIRQHGIDYKLQSRDSHSEEREVGQAQSIEPADQIQNESQQKTSQILVEEPIIDPTIEKQQEEEEEEEIKESAPQSQRPPYERYDSPVQEGEDTEVPSGSVVGMDIQDAQDLYSSPAELGEVISLPAFKPQKIDHNQIYQMDVHRTHIMGNENMRNSETNIRHIPHYTNIKRSDQPPLLSIPGYSSYMAIQKPASIIGSPHSPKRKQPVVHQPTGHEIYSIVSHKQDSPQLPNKRKGPIFYIHKNPGHKKKSYNKLKKEQKKYRYGLRRGLPASNVNGYSPLMASANEIKRKANLRETRQNERSNHSRHNPLLYRPISKFQPKDAITDVFRNKMLYQYIRDRQMRRLPIRV